MILYKYRTDSEYTEKLFNDKKVWLSNAQSLNDPFECSIQEIAKEFIDKSVKITKSGQLEGFFHSAIISMKNRTYFYGLSPKETKSFMKKIKNIKSLNERYKKVNKFIKEKNGSGFSNPRKKFTDLDKQLNEIGIFSLSEDPLNQLMWAHYGEESRGIAIGFEIEKDSKLSNSEYCLKVSYSDELPALDEIGFSKIELLFSTSYQTSQKISFSDPTFQLAVSTKPACWSYEKEWRYIERNSGLYSFPSKVKEIIFGLNAKEETLQKYIELTKSNIKNEVDFYQIKKIKNTNKIDKVKI